MTGRRVIHEPAISIIADWFGIFYQDALILWELHKAKHKLAESELIRRAKCKGASITTHCARIRKALGDEALPRSTRYQGKVYQLSDEGRRQVDEAFRNAAREIGPHFFDDRVQRLEDEILTLREALGLTYKGHIEWGLTPQETEVFGVLSKTTLATNERIRTAVWGMADNPPQDGIIAVVISKMRRKLGPYGIVIKGKWGEGYYLTPESRVIVKAAA